jgi:predicted nicotinamide N-methyase
VSFPTQLQRVQIGKHLYDFYVPDLKSVQENYYKQKTESKTTPFPYWAKLWPAAIALSEFIDEHKELVEEKNVLELAAGLGLPSLVAARFATTVCCSDYIRDVLSIVEETIKHNALSNMYCRLIDWNQLPPMPSPDVLLLSDINYDESNFEVLQNLIIEFITRGTCVLLSTPQRLVAKRFIEALLPSCNYQEVKEIWDSHQKVFISILVFKNES